jgi:hypothetical protein
MTERGLDVTASCPRSMSRWAAITGGIATVVAIGLLIAGLFSPIATHSRATISANPNKSVAASGPAMSEIVPSPVVETNPQFFFGTGDQSAGYYSDRQIR